MRKNEWKFVTNHSSLCRWIDILLKKIRKKLEKRYLKITCVSDEKILPCLCAINRSIKWWWWIDQRFNSIVITFFFEWHQIHYNMIRNQIVIYSGYQWHRSRRGRLWRKIKKRYDDCMVIFHPKRERPFFTIMLTCSSMTSTNKY